MQETKDQPLKKIKKEPHSSKPTFIPDGKKRQICIIGSGNWGSAISRIIAKNAASKSQIFAEEVKMWVFEEEIPEKGKLSEIINKEHENVKYLPGIKLPENIIAEPDLSKASENADLLVIVLPHQFLIKLLPTIKSKISKNCIAISLIKGFDFVNGKPFLLSEVIEKELGIECSVLMGANVANEVAKDQFCEATVGVPEGQEEVMGGIWRTLFDDQYFRVNVVENVPGVELCGGLKNVVALGAGFVDAMQWGGNTKAAIVRIGLEEMKLFIKKFYQNVPECVYFESCGLADLVTTCYGGRNRLCAEEFGKTDKKGMTNEEVWKKIEEEKLKGQKLQGTITCKDVAAVLEAQKIQEEFPLFWSIYQIAFGSKPVHEIINFSI